MSAQASSSSFIQLDWRDVDGHVTVTPSNEDRFTIKMRRAIEVLQKAGEEAEFQQQFNLLLAVLAEWIRDRTDVEHAFVTLRDGRLAFVVVKTDCAYDEQFEDALSDLDVKIADDVDLESIQLDAIALPRASEGAIQTFLHPEFNLVYRGPGLAAQQYGASI